MLNYYHYITVSLTIKEVEAFYFVINKLRIKLRISKNKYNDIHF